MNFNKTCAYAVLISSLVLCGAADEFKQNRPLFYAALAAAAYEETQDNTQYFLDKVLGKHEVTVVDHFEHQSVIFGQTTIIAVKDKHGKFHVAIEGSNEGHNWIGNGFAPINGAVNKYDVPKATRHSLHSRIQKMVRRKGNKKLVSLVGHSQGGMFASQVAASHEDAYNMAQIITFNGFKIKERKNQLHLAIKTEEFATLCSPDKRYTFVDCGKGEWRIISNHQMKYFLKGLRHKEWHDILH